MKLNELQKLLKYRFKDIKLLEVALTHRSYKESTNNERLEFLGDAVLDLIVGEYLFVNYPTYSEGELSKIRAALVNEKSFAKLASFLKLGKFIRLSSAEEHNRGREKPSILSNAFEAVIGAIYLDSSIVEAKTVALEAINASVGKLDPKTLIDDYKTALQEVTQAKFGVIPEYTVISEAGPDHKKEFEIELLISGKRVAAAKGNSKKTAQQNAAKIALEKLERDENE